MKTYDPKKVVLVIGGIPIGGYADGAFINFERVEDAYTTYTGTDGETGRSKSNNKTATLVCTLAQTSDSNDVLSGIAQLDEKANAGVVPCIFKEIDGNTVVFSGACWVRKFATVTMEKEISAREWTLDMADSEVFVGGNNSAF